MAKRREKEESIAGVPRHDVLELLSRHVQSVERGSERGVGDDRFGGQHGLSHGCSGGLSGVDLNGDANGWRRESSVYTRASARRAVHMDSDGVLMALAPDEVPAQGLKEHALTFLLWLQADETFTGAKLPSPLLEKHLYPAFCEAAGLEPYPWRQIAHELRELGVPWQQLDRRKKEQPSWIVYQIPRL